MSEICGTEGCEAMLVQDESRAAGHCQRCRGVGRSERQAIRAAHEIKREYALAMIQGGTTLSGDVVWDYADGHYKEDERRLAAALAAAKGASE